MSPDFASKNPLTAANPHVNQRDLSKHSHASRVPVLLGEVVVEVIEELIKRELEKEE